VTKEVTECTAKVCAECVLPETFPGVHIDEFGVCNHCSEYKSNLSETDEKVKYQIRCEELFEQERGKHHYDALICYSGGKDSSYTLSLLKERYHLNVLAATLDNGFISPQALKNIASLVENLGVDHLFFKPNFRLLAAIFAHCAENDIFPVKTLERASTICTACMTFTKFMALRLAIEDDIPYVIYGWSPGQAPLTSSIMKNNPSMVKMMQHSVLTPLRQMAGDEIVKYFLTQRHFEQPERFPYNIHPLAFLPYDEDQIYSTISRLGWEPPRDVDPNSSNCQLNSYANVIHQQRFGVNPYVFELAHLVRTGCLDRQAALNRLNLSADAGALNKVGNKLRSYLE